MLSGAGTAVQATNSAITMTCFVSAAAGWRWAWRAAAAAAARCASSAVNARA